MKPAKMIATLAIAGGLAAGAVGGAGVANADWNCWDRCGGGHGWHGHGDGDGGGWNGGGWNGGGWNGGGWGGRLERRSVRHWPAWVRHRLRLAASV
jgi:hypothetical protein